MNWTPKPIPMDVARTIPNSVETIEYLVFVPLQVRMEFAENHLVHGKSSTKSSKVKPLNYYYF